MTAHRGATDPKSSGNDKKRYLCYYNRMAGGNYTVRSQDTSLSELSAREALSEIEKLKIYGLAATVYDRDGQFVSISDLEVIAWQTVETDRNPTPSPAAAR